MLCMIHYFKKFDDETPTNLKLFFNVDCETQAAARLESQLEKAAETKNFTIQNSGKFKMKQKEGVEEIELEFFT